MKKIHKILAILLSLSLFISSCGGEESELPDGETADQLQYETETFGILFPQDWEILEGRNLTSEVPLETVVNFRNNLRNEVHTANVNISITNLESDIGLGDFVASTLNNAKNTLVEFSEISAEETSVSTANDNISGTVLEFEGRKDALSNPLIFKQLLTINNGTGYAVTASYLPNEDQTVIIWISEMLNSFSLR